jgi:hypothetical protein
MAPVFSLLYLAILLLTVAHAATLHSGRNLPWGNGDVSDDIETHQDLSLNYTQVQDLRGRAAKDFYLRIMPLGASITEGSNAAAGNGYRKHIRDQLRYRKHRLSKNLSFFKLSP